MSLVTTNEELKEMGWGDNTDEWDYSEEEIETNDAFSEVKRFKHYFIKHNQTVLPCMFCQKPTELGWKGVYDHIPSYWCEDCSGREESFVEYHLDEGVLPERIVKAVSFHHFRKNPNKDKPSGFTIVYQENNLIIRKALSSQPPLCVIPLEYPFEIKLTPANVEEKFDHYLAFM